MKLVFSAQEGAIAKLFDEIEDEISKAATGAVKDAAREAVKEGRANIASAGFSSRWQRALTYKFYPNEGKDDPAAVIYHKIWFAGVFERGATISGRPLLWLPIEQNVGDVKSPKQLGKKLVSVNIAGKSPLLFDAADRQRGPLFVGVRSVDIRKRFGLYAIYAAVAKRMREFYEQRIKD